MTSAVHRSVRAAARLGERLGRVVHARPGAVAIVDGERRVTYGELLRRADALAGALHDRGIGPGGLVGVALPRSAELVVAVAGIVRAGAAYVPIDLAHPAERRALVLSDARPRCVVTDGSSVDCVPDGAETLALPQAGPESPAAPPRLADDDPAYVIYTSGSTGRPNGVVVTQRNAARLFTACEPLFLFGADDVWTLFHSIAFDFSVWELWGALLHGGRLVVVPSATARSADAFHALVLREGVTVLNQTPSAFRAFDAADEAAGRPANSLRHVVFGGEALDPRTLGRWFDAHGDERPRLVNMYGITETTVHVTHRRMLAADARGAGRSVIGAPLPDLRIDLLDAHGRPVADGEIGEIHVGGAGVSAGYLGREELTARRFRPDPRAEAGGARIYRSGDLGRRLPGGDIEYLGRADLQIKLRGFRIEPGEIESVLRSASGVRDAVVSLREDTALGPRLVAHVVPGGAAPLDPRALRDHVAARLPEHMVPAAYVTIAGIPRTVNDKADRAALPEPTAADMPRGAGGEAPRAGTEERLAAIWRELLGVADVRRDDEFVALGGHSLLAARVALLCGERLGAAISSVAVLDARTLSALAARVDSARRVERAAASQEPSGPVPLTPGQRALLLQQQFAGASPVLNETAALDLLGALDTAVLVAALRDTLAAHPAFRTRLSNIEGEPAQEPAPGADVTVELVEAPGAGAGAVRAVLVETASRSFDLLRGPLARACIVRRAPDHHTLLVVAHHLVLDEWSVALVLEETGARLRGESPPGPPDPGPFAHAARRGSPAASTISEARAFWRAELDGATFEAGFDATTDVVDDVNAGATAECALDERQTALVRTSLRRAGATEFEGGLAALAAVLEHEAHRPDVVVLTTLADRDRAETAGVAGYLLDVLPVRIGLAGDPTARDVLSRVRAAVARTSVHRSLPVGEAAAAGGLSLVAAGRGAGAVFFTRREEIAGRLRAPGVRAAQIDLHLGAAKFDCSVHLVSGEARLTVRVEHRLQSVDGAAARRLAARVASLLIRIAAAPETRLAEIDVLEPEERWDALARSHGPAGPAPPWPLVPDRVAEVARERPADPAVVEDGRTVGYGELLDAADGLAGELRARGVGAGDVVPVVGRRSAALVAAWLGVLRAGAAYAPIDPDQPAARRAAMIEDCRARIVVADAGSREAVPEGCEVLDLPIGGVGARGAALVSAPASPASADALAYVVFTSGSTGRPKGVEIGHAALAHVVAWYRRRFGLTPRDRLPLLAGIGFDATVLDTWATLCSGGAVQLPSEDVRLDPARLRDWIVDRKVTIAFAPTILVEALLDLTWPAATSLRSLLAGGEALRRRPARGLPFDVVNLYGPAEAAVWVTHAVVDPEGGELPPIGVPLDDMSAYVVDHRGRICGDGVLGELWLAGPQLARGYRGLPERTAESFPGEQVTPGRRERVYRTGDLVRRRADGVIDFVGRRDGQVKLRGVRIEIGEIEASLLGHPAVAACAVALRGGPEAPHLAAWVEPSDPRSPPAAAALSGWLAQRLPRAMVPARWSVIGALPRSPNGKIDRRALPDVPDGAAEEDSGAPPTPSERRILAIWRDVLGNATLGPDADFFAAGGHSLLAVRMLARVESESGVRLPARVLFEGATPRRMAGLISASAGGRLATPSCVLRIRDGGTGTPLFCLPGIGGHAFQYRELAARMRDGRPILALQLHDLGAPPSTFESIDATAAAFVRHVRSVQPRGPYALAGYSYGGLVALEIARHLLASGETVAFVGLVDAYAPGTARPASRLRKLVRHAANLVTARSLGTVFEYVRHRVRRQARRISFKLRELRGAPRDAQVALDQEVEETSIRCVRALESYAARPYPGRVAVFRAARVGEWTDIDDPTGTCGWEPLCESVDAVDLDCAHLDLFKEPHICELAGRLDDALGRVRP